MCVSLDYLTELENKKTKNKNKKKKKKSTGAVS